MFQLSNVMRRATCLALAVATLLSVAFLSVAIPAQASPAPHKTWVQRHPTMTAIGAAIATHHALKVSARRHKAHGHRLNWAERHPTLSAIGVGGVTHHVIKKHTPH